MEVLAQEVGLARVDLGQALAPGLAGAPSVGQVGWAAARVRARTSSSNSSSSTPPLLVLRTPNFSAGVDGSYKRHVNTALGALYSARTVAALRRAFGPVQLLVWDVQAMARGLPVERSEGMAARCHSQHATSEDMDLQVQVLLNALCN